jgi:putative phosphoserine phosphatase / 1-acylglycerol-3-phosphate O-acyltransferase
VSLRLAVFDLDGTLLDGDSHALLLWELLGDASVPPRARARIVAAALAWALGLAPNAEIKAVAARALRGRSVAALAPWWASFHARRVAPRLRPWMVERARIEREEGRAVVLLSASLHPVVACAGEAVGARFVVAARLEAKEGALTGRLDGEVPWGPAKARALDALAAQTGADLSRSTGYGDGRADIDFLQRVGGAFAVTPDAGLRACARRRGWPILGRD